MRVRQVNVIDAALSLVTLRFDGHAFIRGCRAHAVLIVESFADGVHREILRFDVAENEKTKEEDVFFAALTIHELMSERNISTCPSRKNNCPT